MNRVLIVYLAKFGPELIGGDQLEKLPEKCVFEGGKASAGEGLGVETSCKWGREAWNTAKCSTEEETKPDEINVSEGEPLECTFNEKFFRKRWENALVSSQCSWKMQMSFVSWPGLLNQVYFLVFFSEWWLQYFKRHMALDRLRYPGKKLSVNRVVEIALPPPRAPPPPALQQKPFLEPIYYLNDFTMLIKSFCQCVQRK